MADLITYTDLQTYLATGTGQAITFGAGEQTMATLACGAATTAINTATGRNFAAQDSVATLRYFTPYRAGDTRAFSSFPWNPGAWGYLPYFFYPIPAVPDRIVPIDDLFLTNQVIGDLVFKDHAPQARARLTSRLSSAGSPSRARSKMRRSCRQVDISKEPVLSSAWLAMTLWAT